MGSSGTTTTTTTISGTMVSISITVAVAIVHAIYVAALAAVCLDNIYGIVILVIAARHAFPIQSRRRRKGARGPGDGLAASVGVLRGRTRTLHRTHRALRIRCPRNGPSGAGGGGPLPTTGGGLRSE